MYVYFKPLNRHLTILYGKQTTLIATCSKAVNTVVLVYTLYSTFYSSYTSMGYQYVSPDMRGLIVKEFSCALKKLSGHVGK